jgi:chromatin segregation and condensation protein Rec8/ScpA/Scc1 (kleisin family)
MNGLDFLLAAATVISLAAALIYKGQRNADRIEIKGLNDDVRRALRRVELYRTFHAALGLEQLPSTENHDDPA